MSPELDKELSEKDFRVVVFGSARTKKGEPEYKQVYDLGYAIGAMGADIVTGGGPGMMEAASWGHTNGKMGNGHSDAHSIGIGIELPMEQHFNKHLDIKEEHDRFSSRLDTFMALSNIVVITPGGIGTLLEFSYTLQLIQVGHLCKIPIVLLGDMWPGLIGWIEQEMVGRGYADDADLDVIEIVDTVDEAMDIIKKTHKCFENGDYDACLNWEKYRAM